MTRLLGQRVADDGDAHAVRGDIIGGRQLVELQNDVRLDAVFLKNLVRPDSGVVAGPQKNAGVLGEKGQRDCFCRGLQVPAAANVRQRQLVFPGRLIGGEFFRHGEEQAFAAEQVLFINGLAERVIIHDKIQSAGKQLRFQLGGIGLDQVDSDGGIFPDEFRNDRRQDEGGEDVIGADQQATDLQAV